MSANFSPTLQPYKETGAFRYWCQHVIPLVYDDSLSYYELLCKVVNYLNDVISNVDGLHTDVEDLLTAYNELQEYVNNYFSDLNVQTQIDNKLDKMAQDGTLANIINDEIFNQINSDISVLKSKVATIETDITNIDTDITNIENKLNTPPDKKFIFIGDSYNASEHHGGWGSKVITYLNLTPGVNVWNTGRSGASFGDTSGNSFYNAIYSVTQTLSEAQRNSITDIIIEGDINDWASAKADIQAGVSQCLSYIKTNYPFALTTIILCGWSYENDTIRAGAISAYNAVVQSAHNARVIDNMFTLFLDPAFLETDMVHPTESGMELLGSLICNAIYGGNANNIKYTDLNTKFTSNGGSKEIKVYGDITPTGYHLYKSNSDGINFNSPITITHGSPGTLIAVNNAQDNNNLFMRNCSFPCSVLYALSGNQYKDGRGIITVKKRSDSEQIWDMYLSSESILTSDYPVENVTGVYLLFDVMVDITKS